MAKVKPSISCKTVLIFGNGNGFLTIRLLTSLRSLSTLIVWSFFVDKMLAKPTPTRAAKPESQYHTFSVFLLLVFLCVLWVPDTACHGICGLAPSFSSIGAPVQYPRSLVCHQTNLQILIEDSTVLSADVHLGVCIVFPQSLGDLFFSYLASKIFTAMFVSSLVLSGSSLKMLLFTAQAFSILDFSCSLNVSHWQ